MPKSGSVSGVVRSREKAYLIDRRFVNLVVVLIFEGIDPVGNRLEVLGDENTVGFRTGDHRRLVFEHRRVVFGNILHRIGRKEANETFGYAVGRVAVGRISRNDHRIHLRAGREDVTHRVERIALVVVAHGTAEIQRVGRVLLERILDLDQDAPAPDRKLGFLLHLGRREKLFCWSLSCTNSSKVT